MHLRVHDSTRYSHLRLAKNSFERFIRICLKHNIVKAKDINYDEDGGLEEVCNIAMEVLYT